MAFARRTRLRPCLNAGPQEQCAEVLLDRARANVQLHRDLLQPCTNKGSTSWSRRVILIGSGLAWCAAKSSNRRWSFIVRKTPPLAVVASQSQPSISTTFVNHLGSFATTYDERPTNGVFEALFFAKYSSNNSSYPKGHAGRGADKEMHEEGTGVVVANGSACATMKPAVPHCKRESGR